ncbi:MAG: hypothetical protein ABI181_08210, partial [Mycobacteriaceae bacterium]
MSSWTVGLQQLRDQVESRGQLEAAARRWERAGAPARQTGDAAAAQAAKLGASWSGSGAEAVLGYTTQLSGAFDALPEAGSAVARALRGAESALHHAHDVISRLIVDVDAAVATLPQSIGTPGWETAAAAVVGAAQTQARAAVDDTEHALTTASRTVIGAATDTPFTDLPPIAAQPFEPARFDPVQWNPQQVAHTTSRDVRPGVEAAPDGGAGGGSSGDGSAGGDGGDGGAGAGVGGDGGLGPSGGPPGGGGHAAAAPAQVKAWIDEAMAIMKAAG